MFRAYLRSLSGPRRGHVCLSCLTRRYGVSPVLCQFHTSRVLPSESGNGPGPAQGPPLPSEGLLTGTTNAKKPENFPENKNAEPDSSSNNDQISATEGLGEGGDVPYPSAKEEKKALRRARRAEARQKLRKAQSRQEPAKKKNGKKEAQKTYAQLRVKKIETQASKGKPGAIEELKGIEKRREQEESRKSRTTTRGDQEDPKHMGFLLKQSHKKDVGVLGQDGLDLKPLDVETAPVPQLSFGLERVLFNPGVYHLRDPRSRVFNFDPYLGSIMPVTEFDFNALKEYITSSKDDTLRNIARNENKKYVGSSSSMTSVLSQFHYLLSAWRGIDVRTLSQGFPEKLRTFTRLLRSPSAMFLRYQDGVYAIDADKEFDSANILMNLGKSMEKLLTLPKEEFERYRRSSENKISPEEEQAIPESYHYSTLGDFIMRSQLDAYDPRLPGTGMFDLKTRAVVSIRMDAQNFEHGLGYEIKGQYGAFESYEREFFDMIRAAFLKYSLQVRVGRMDGIFVAFHNIERIFGFQYVSLPEMDQTLHGTSDTTLGDTEFRLSLGMWNKILNKVTERFPQRSLRFHFETRDAVTPFMYIFAEPVTDEEIHAIQTRNAAEINAYQERVLNLNSKGENATKENAEVEEADAATWKDEPTADAKQSSSTETEGQSTEPVEAQEQNKPEPVASPAPEEAQSSPVDPAFTEGSQTSTPEKTAPSAEPLTEQTPKQQTNQNIHDTSAPPDETLLSDLESESASEPETPPRELFAMTLVVRNMINGKRVDRPNDFKPGDEWNLEYELTELPSERAHALYVSCQKRRQKALEGRGEDETDVANNVYIRKLREISEAGRKFRAEQDRVDKENGVVVLDDLK